MSALTTRAMSVNPDGDVRELDLGAGAHQLDALHRAIGSDTLDMLTVTPQLLMWVDDEGVVNGSAVNAVATALVSATPQLRSQPIRGVVVFTGAAGPQGDVTPLAPEWVQILRSHGQAMGST
ncbi:MAG TPA: DUF3846 domain-containing protein [Nakamurella sp.]